MKYILKHAAKRYLETQTPTTVCWLQCSCPLSWKNTTKYTNILIKYWIFI